MPGKHRKPSPLKITLRTTGGLVAGAAVIGTATVTAQAAVGAAPAGSAAAKAPAAAAAVQPGAPKKKSHDVPEKLSGDAGRASTAPSAAGASKAPVKTEPKKPTADDAIKLAKSQVGISEDENGETKFNEWYMGTDRAKETLERDGGDLEGYSDAQWCDMFVSWIGEELGFGHGMGSDAWTVEHAKWFEEQDRWGTEPRPGAIVFFDWGGSKDIDDIVHVGMVVKDNGDGTVQTVEGNTSNAVKIRERPAGQIVGYGYPDYAK
ncbi:CHAP domain-containing protein [Spirillospora sp. NPDC047279]|uniref:CHAP domain-containing protein n=1 Tax=Spirillospora sp. NPDC047279 TaxID=3155478 RepID=UPI0033E74A45